MPEQLQFPPDYWLAVIDDTDEWDPDLLRLYDVQRTWTVYLFDRNTSHHLCELTPSYMLVPVSNGFVGEDHLFSDLQDDAVDWSPIYMHCRMVDALPPDRLIHIHSLLEQEGLDTRPLLQIDCPQFAQHCSIEEECRDAFHSGRWNVAIDENGECIDTIKEAG